MHRMIEMHSKYDNMHINVMFYALNCINNHFLSCYDCMLSDTKSLESLDPNRLYTQFHVHRVLKIEIWMKDEEEIDA